jgi:hypothetical protein
MNKLIALALVLIFGTAAQGKPAPVDPHSIAFSSDLATSSEPSATPLERDYFRAPQAGYAAGRVFPCRLRVFDKSRLALSCR